MRGLLLLAILPGLYWDKGPQTSPAVKQAGIDRLYVPAGQKEAWSKVGLDAIATDPANRIKLTAPGVEYRMNEAAATSLPWIDANGWRMERDPQGAYYYDVQAAAVALAMAESYARNAAAVIHSGGDPASFGRMLAFLKRIDQAPMPQMANIGLIDDGSKITGEAMNLLARRNLLFRVVKAAHSGLDLTIRPGKEAANPFAYAQEIRQRLGDEKRLVRLYGSDVVLANLTGDGTKARLHLVNYSNRKVTGLRVRVRGTWAKGGLLVFGMEKAALADYQTEGGATEFTVPEMAVYAVVDLAR